MAEELNPRAAYGLFAFDQFVLEHFDFEAPASSLADQQQWNTLSHRFLALDAVGRVPYQHRTFNLEYCEAIDPRFPTTSQIDRAFRPFQTVHERNACTARNVACEHPLWLRTCYDPELEDKYQDLRTKCEACTPYSVDDEEIFEDEALYADRAGGDETETESGLEALVLRAPMLADVRMFYTIEEAEQWAEDVDNDEDEIPPEMVDIESASKQAWWLVYLVDEEVLRDGKDLVKMMWMNEHGKPVWHNRINPSRMAGFRGAMADGRPLVMLVEESSVAPPSGNEDDVWQPGAVFL
ncbi:hypothetical protein GQ53DRAFT_805800 [Thozetella sp. PMI_491]|nr:hypothetical protein GQ53DRAFT_805800 [Thozetella sp. PMI_491]